MKNKTRFRRDLQDLLAKYEIDKYCDLHSYMLSEHLVRWIEEYVRQHNVAIEWALSTDRQKPYYDYMTKQGDPNVNSKPDSRTAVENPSKE